VEDIDGSRQEKNEVLEKIREAGQTKVVVHKYVQPGVVIFLNDAIFEVKNELNNVAFVFEKESNQVGFFSPTEDAQPEPASCS
jgi:uncharacterized protein (DUF342 family)